jgi:hypothetical protein
MKLLYGPVDTKKGTVLKIDTPEISSQNMIKRFMMLHGIPIN